VTGPDDCGVVTVTFDDPDTRNALSLAVLADLGRTLTRVTDDPAVRAVLLTGAGSTFSSGADRSEIIDPSAVAAAARHLEQVLELVATLPVPVVARVNGPAFGAGLALVASADIAVARADALFGFPEVRMGLVAGPALAACRARIGRSALLDLFLTGRRFDAATAHRIGLVAHVVGADELDAAVAAVLTDLEQGDPAALAATKHAIRGAGAAT
jgi:methylglutaconyl-CoA hydratase